MTVKTLYRPVGPKELELIRASGFRAFPPRLPEQPIFYPVLNEEYAREIAERWNVPESGRGYVTRISVDDLYASQFPVQTVGALRHAGGATRRVQSAHCRPDRSQRVLRRFRQRCHMSNFFVEFKIVEPPRFQQLERVVAALREAKSSDEWHDDIYWLDFFDAAARATFWWPTDEERAHWRKRWEEAPVATRFDDPTLQTPWDFGSMVEAFRNGEFVLLACRQRSGSTWRLEFDPFAGPYGGSGCIVALVEAFGHTVTDVSS